MTSTTSVVNLSGAANPASRVHVDTILDDPESPLDALEIADW